VKTPAMAFEARSHPVHVFQFFIASVPQPLLAFTS